MCIQRESTKQQSNELSQDENIDILEPVKQCYYQTFLKEIDYSGPISELPNVQDTISRFIENISNLSSNFYSTNKKFISKEIPKSSQKDTEQLLNYTTAELCHSYEKVADSFIKFLAEDDSLRSSKNGRLIRQIIPSQEQKNFDKTVATSKKEIKDLTKEFTKQVGLRNQR